MTAQAQQASMQLPVFWRKFLIFVGIGKAAIAGAGLTLAFLGALDIAAAITAQHWWVEHVQANMNAITAGGGVAGGIAGWVFNRLT